MTLSERWEETGLMEGLNQSQSDELAIEFDKISKIWLSIGKDCSGFSFVLPITRRLYSEINKFGKFSFIIEVSQLFWDIKEKFDKFSTEEINLEAKFCSVYCENYIKDLKKRGII